MKFVLSLLVLLISFHSFSKAKEWTPKYQSRGMEKNIIKKDIAIGDDKLITLFKDKDNSEKYLKSLKKQVIKSSNKAVPTLIRVMKSKDFPDHKRWIATFMLGQIMGEKSAPFIAKFSAHPNWMMRLAAIKTLMVLKEKKYLGVYSKALNDKALIVRQQALEVISTLGLTELAPSVWRMLYDKKNYAGKKGKTKRTSIIGKVIRTIGDLGFQKARKPLLSMITNKKFSDIFEELDYSLNKISSQKSPKGSHSKKYHFWKRKKLEVVKI